MKKFALNIIKKIRTNIRNKITNGSAKVKEINETFKETLQKSKIEPVSKRKSAVLGFCMVLTIFGFTLLVPFMSAVAKEISAPSPGNPAQKFDLASRNNAHFEIYLVEIIDYTADSRKLPSRRLYGPLPR